MPLTRLFTGSRTARTHTNTNTMWFFARYRRLRSTLAAASPSAHATLISTSLVAFQPIACIRIRGLWAGKLAWKLCQSKKLVRMILNRRIRRRQAVVYLHIHKYKLPSSLLQISPIHRKVCVCVSCNRAFLINIELLERLWLLLLSSLITSNLLWTTFSSSWVRAWWARKFDNL